MARQVRSTIKEKCWGMQRIRRRTHLAQRLRSCNSNPLCRSRATDPSLGFQRATGPSFAGVSREQLELLAVTESYLVDTFAVPLEIIGSD